MQSSESVTVSTNSTIWNGGVCTVCGARYLGSHGSHDCSPLDLMKRAAELERMAREKFERMSPQPTTGPADPTRGCPCRPENGGSGVCGCILGGPRIT